jgi:hypothetical protein
LGRLGLGWRLGLGRLRRLLRRLRLWLRWLGRLGLVNSFTLFLFFIFNQIIPLMYIHGYPYFKSGAMRIDVVMTSISTRTTGCTTSDMKVKIKENIQTF